MSGTSKCHSSGHAAQSATDDCWTWVSARGASRRRLAAYTRTCDLELLEISRGHGECGSGMLRWEERRSDTLLPSRLASSILRTAPRRDGSGRARPAGPTEAKPFRKLVGVSPTVALPVDLVGKRKNSLVHVVLLVLTSSNTQGYFTKDRPLAKFKSVFARAQGTGPTRRRPSLAS